MPLHRTESASLHSDGGAFHDVTHGQRKYHYLRVCVMADCLPRQSCGADVSRSPVLEVLAHLPRGSAHTERIRLPYSVVMSGNPPAKKWKCSALSRNDCIIPVLYFLVDGWQEAERIGQSSIAYINGLPLRGKTLG